MLKRFLSRRRHEARLEALAERLEGGDWGAAEAMARKAVAEAAAIFGADDPALVAPQHALAAALLAQGKLEDAETSALAAIRIARGTPGLRDPGLGALYQQLAAIFDRRGEVAALEKLLRDLVGRYDRMRAPDPQEQLAALSQLALLFARSDRSELAAPLFTRAIALQERSSDAVALATLLHNAATYDPDRSRAIARFERAQVLAPPGDLAGRIAHNLAVAYEASGDPSRARLTYRAALGHFEGSGSPLRPTLARLGRLEHAAGDFEAAAVCYERALAIARGELGPDDAIVARLALWLGDARSHVFR